MIGRSGRHVGGPLAGLLLSVALVVGLSVGVTATAAAADTASVNITKVASTETITPGVPFTYTINFECTAGTVDGCVNATVTDTLPPGLTIVGDPTLTGNTNGTVTHDTTSLTVNFADDLGVDGVGLAAGVPITLTVPVVLDADYPYAPDQQPLINTATISADNATPDDASVPVTPDVELQLAATTTKTLDPHGPDLPIPGTPVTATVTGTSTSNSPVDVLVINDPVDPTATPNPFTYLDVTSIGTVTLPAGAETVQVRAWVDGAWVDGVPGPPPAVLPDGVDGTEVTGLQFVFTSTTDPGIDPNSPAGVQLNLVQAPEIVNAPLPLTVTNTADTTVSLGNDSAASEPASDTYLVVPADIAVAAGKSFDPETVHAGDPSQVTVTGTNTSQTLPLDSLTVSDDPLPAGLTFTGLGTDGAGAGILWPQGATAAAITYSCAGVAGTPQPTSTVNTLPAPPVDCVPVTGLTVTFTGSIVPGAEATIPFGVVTDPDQAQEELTRTNQVDVTGVLDALPPATDNATADILSIIDRLDIVAGKTIISPQTPLPSIPGQGVIVELSGVVQPFPVSTTDAHQIIVQDPDPLAGDEWFGAFQPEGVVSTPIPANSTLTVQYWDGTQWVDVPGMVDIPGPDPSFSGEFPPDVQQNAQGIRFVYTSTEPEPDGFPPGTTVSPNLGFTLRDSLANSGDTITNCAGSSAVSGDTSAVSDPACDDITLIPPDSGAGVNPIDKVWDRPAVPERSQEQAGVTLSWSTAGFINVNQVVISDTQDPDTTPLPASMFDSFDLVRIDPITPDRDSRLTFDEITGVELFRIPAGSTDPAAGSWQNATNDPCPDACDGTFPGYTLTGDESATTLGFRLTYIESPTRAERINSPTDPPVGTGVAVSSGNNRHIDPVFQVRDELRSNPDVPVTADRAYNAGTAGQVVNTVRATGSFSDPAQIFTRTDSATIVITDVPVTAHAEKTWTGGPLGIPEEGVTAGDYPTGRITLTGQNTRPAKVDQLLISDPVTGTPNPFDDFNMVGFVSITDPASIGATDVTISLTRTADTQDYTRDEALALTGQDLEDVTGMVFIYTGRINAGANALIVFDARLRQTSRTTDQPPTPGATFTDTVGVAVTDLADYPGMDPETATDAAAATIDVVAQGIGVTAGKSFSPNSQTEPDNGPVVVTLSGQPSGPSRAIQMVLEDISPTFWNQYDLIALSPVTFVAPIDRVQVDALTGGTWSVVGAVPELTGASWVSGDPTAGPDVALPVGVTPDQVQGLRFTFNRDDGANWENPANPTQPISFTAARRVDLNTGGPVPSDLSGNSPAPGETAAGVATDDSRATVISSDIDTNGDLLTATDDATATILYRHATNAVSVEKTPDGAILPPGQDFTYTLTTRNTGDVPITNPVITDVFPADADGPQVLIPADGPGYAYTLDPVGTAAIPMPTDPAQVTVAESPSGLQFTFPAGSTLEVGQTYTISFKAEIRPGLPADTAFTNSYGVTGDRAWDECAGTLDPDTGQCRASAVNTVQSAGAIEVTKQVKAQGSDVLGVELDPLATARECLADGDGFYSRPCVPIAQPGGEITWRVQVVNVGNRLIDRIVSVDQLPAPGDTLATAANLERGSQWRPLLEGPRPTLATGTGTLSVYYATDPVHCTSQLGRDGDCPEVAWTEWPQGQDLPVDPALVTGIKTVVDLETPMAPTDFVNIDFLMLAPAISPTEGADTIAYNTVGTGAHSVGGDPNDYTLTTEPPRVGVGLATGPLQVVKRVTGDAADQYAPETFAATLVCTSVGVEVPLPDDQANLTLTADVPVLIEDLPWGATCTITEEDNGQTAGSSTTATVIRELTEVQTAELTNVYDYASLSVSKLVDSTAVDQEGTAIPFGPFTVLVTCNYLEGPVYADDYGPLKPMQAVLQDQQEVTFTGLPGGADCTVTETDDKGAAGTTMTVTAGEAAPVEVTGTEATVTLEPGTDSDVNVVSVTNEFGVGSVSLQKVVTGDAADIYGAGPFTVHLDCTLTDDSGTRPVYDGDVVLGGDEPLTATIDNLVAGAECDVTEPDDGGASTVSIDNPRLVVGDDQTAEIKVTNSFDPGQVVLTKAITGDAAAYAPTSFEVTVTCSANGAVLPGFPTIVTVSAGQDTIVPTLVGATCAATETGSGSATGVTYLPADPDDPTQSGEVTVTTGEPAAITIGNEYRAGGLQITKTITGPGETIGAGPFTFGVTCSFDGRFDSYTGTVTLQPEPGATSVTSPVIAPLPVGAVCVITETGSGGADLTPPPVTVTILDVDSDGVAQVVVAGFVNAFSAGTVQISKIVDGGGAYLAAGRVFTVVVTCQLADTGTGTITLFAGPVTVTGGQTVPVSDATGTPVLLPLGARCFAAETDSGGANAVTVDYDSFENAAVVTGGDTTQDLTITVTNTFDAPPVAPTHPVTPSAPAPQLPNTGAPVDTQLGWAAWLLALGTLLVVAGQRRATGRPDRARGIAT